MDSSETLLSSKWSSLEKRRVDDPHLLLGLHSCGPEQKVIRLYRPGATSIHLEVFGEIVGADRVDERGIFECIVSNEMHRSDYRIFHQSGLLACDPYAFAPRLGEWDQYLYSRGVHYQLYRWMGAQLTDYEAIAGVQFAVWAPSALSVSLVGDFNYWDGRTNPMTNVRHSGIWMLFIPGLTAGAKYKFEIQTNSGALHLKADPYAFSSELRPATASIVSNTESFVWEDREWMEKRVSSVGKSAPMIVYELHLGSWKRSNGQFLNYCDLARDLASYCREMGYTHVELLPIQEHPLDESWGYQVSSFFAPTSRFGKAEDFQWFVNHLHKNEIGVILDWVPGHFVTDQFALGRFDGTALYEHESSSQGFHPHWHTYIFNHGRHEVSNFLISSALYWFDRMHIDGLRVDAVASMIYLDYGRENGEWIPNCYGGNENLEAIEFLKHLNSIAHQQFPGVTMIAEESTAFTGISHPLSGGGIGFDMKWNMGWMHDTLRYLSTDTLFRSYHQNDLTFGLLYAFSERFMLALSHDEVVHGKRSLLSKMAGDLWQQFANMRLLYSYMICQPGKKLLFMGGDIGQWNEWNCKGEVEWFLLQYPTHSGLQKMIKELNSLYMDRKALWQRDFDPSTFQWVDFGDSKNCVISYLRKGDEEILLCVHNFTPSYYDDYFIALRGVQLERELFNSDAAAYGGSGKLNGEVYPAYDQHGSTIGYHFKLSPLATMIFSCKTTR